MKLNSLLITFCFFLLIVNGTSCQNRHSGISAMPSKECIELNNDGGKYLMNYPRDGDSLLNKAIDKFEQAVRCDSTYFTAYINLSTAYDYKGSYDKEMIAFNKLLKLIPNDAVLFEQKAELFERMGKPDSAKIYYLLSSVAFQRRLAKDPANEKTIANIVDLKAITDGKDAAKKELDYQINKHPELSRKLAYEYEMLNLFNRESAVFRKTVVSDGPAF